MLPIVDTHVHLCAGRDDGPGTLEEAVAMCRMLVAEGARTAAALAHQNDTYPENTPAALLQSIAELAAVLTTEKIPLVLAPTAEVMASGDLATRFAAGEYLTVANRGQYLLVEQPHRIFVDYIPLAAALKPHNIRIIVAHAERYPEMLHDNGLTERTIAAGCLIQITARSLTHPANIADERALREWVTRGFVHCLGSDGHGLERRPPHLRQGHSVLSRWVGAPAADRIGNIWASSILAGRLVNPPRPQPPKKSWFTKLLGG
ncbi:MAG: tyrosine-protein phosphatase [Gemmataceae bacterium]